MPSSNTPQGLNAVSFGPAGTVLATSNWIDRTVVLWDVATGDRRATLTSDGRTSVEDLTFS
jgi:WD40 repeat protein